MVNKMVSNRTALAQAGWRPVASPKVVKTTDALDQFARMESGELFRPQAQALV